MYSIIYTIHMYGCLNMFGVFNVQNALTDDNGFEQQKGPRASRDRFGHGPRGRSADSGCWGCGGVACRPANRT